MSEALWYGCDVDVLPAHTTQLTVWIFYNSIFPIGIVFYLLVIINFTDANNLAMHDAAMNCVRDAVRHMLCDGTTTMAALNNLRLRKI